MASIPPRQLYRTLIVAIAVALLGCARMMGLFLPILVVAQALCVPFLIWAYFKQPERRRLNAVQSAIWLAVPMVIFAWHFVQYKLDRARADEIVAAIEQFIAANHRCPGTLDEIGYSKAALDGRPMLPVYGCDGDGTRPWFAYSVGYAPFAMYNHDFDKHEWYADD